GRLGDFSYPKPHVGPFDFVTSDEPLAFEGLNWETAPGEWETGFLYMRNRYYDPDLGRFISTDPMDYNDAPSLYQYGLNDPVNNSDPMGEEVYLVYREFNIDGLRERFPDIGHVYLAFDSKGLENPAEWRDLVNRLGFQPDPLRYTNTNAETFSFHPDEMRSGNNEHNLAWTICTTGSYIGYNDRFDQDTFRGGLEGARGRLVLPLGVSQEQQERLYRAAITSRNTNNKLVGYGDIGTYKFFTNNCGTWAKYIVESNGVSWPDEARNFNQGVGINGMSDRMEEFINGLTQGVCVGGTTMNNIRDFARACKESWHAGKPSSAPTPPAPEATEPTCESWGCVDPQSGKPIR
ncbi:MAG: RHS repeat-associated core domain-containing protein, partial [Thermoanaerobaculia bacterium]